MRSFIALIFLTLIVSPAAASEPKPNPEPAPAPAKKTAADGTTTEVRYVSAPPNRKGSRVSKLIITRDANGKIISVKRG